MYAAYGRAFTVEQIRYIARQPDPLSLAGWVASGSIYLRFEPKGGYVAEEGFVAPRPQHISAALWTFTFFGAAMEAVASAFVFQNQNGPAVASALIGVFGFLLTLIEFVDVRRRHNARRAIEACARASGVQKIDHKNTAAWRRKWSWRLFRVRRGLV